jgi:sugar phosphate isomerase/epimerase
MLALAGAGARLTYCLNAHPGATAAAADEALFARAPAILARAAAAAGRTGPFGPGLWLGQRVAAALREPAARARFVERVRTAGLAPFTANAFPMGAFHGEAGPVKAAVYRPDWSSPARAAFTLDVASVLAALGPPDGEATVSTLPLGDAADLDPGRADLAVVRLAETALALDRLGAATGVTVRLALEPEPDCALERLDEGVAFFEERLLRAGAEAVRRAGGVTRARAEDLLRRHLGLCLDTVHAAVVGEDAVASLHRAAAAGVAVPKVQLGAALRCPWAERAALAPWAEPTYLHQTRVTRPDGRDRRFRDLPDALVADVDDGRVALVHFHVPLAWPGRGPLSATSEAVSPALLRAALAAGARHFEVEIYTLGVVPGASPDRAAADDALVADLRWVLALFDRLGAP